jgi:hypothetical protein
MLFFYNVNLSFSSFSVSFKRELFLLSYKMKDDHRTALTSWLDCNP